MSGRGYPGYFSPIEPTKIQNNTYNLFFLNEKWTFKTEIYILALTESDVIVLAQWWPTRAVRQFSFDMFKLQIWTYTIHRKQG